MNTKDYNGINIRDEINKKINGYNRTRDNRIHASERLYSYSSKWDTVFFIMNIIAVSLVIGSLMNIGSHVEIFVSSCFSLYTVILQYYYNCLNYKERALKYHYQQLEIEKYILELKELLRLDKTNSELEERYKVIWNRYISTLSATENHSKFDDETVIFNKEGSGKRPRDFSADNILYYLNIVVIILIITLYVVDVVGTII